MITRSTIALSLRSIATIKIQVSILSEASPHSHAQSNSDHGTWISIVQSPRYQSIGKPPRTSVMSRESHAGVAFTCPQLPRLPASTLHTMFP